MTNPSLKLNDDGDRAAQVDQILGLLESQFAELDHREQSMNRSFAKLAQQRDELARRIVETEKREQKICDRESAAADIATREAELRQQSEKCRRDSEQIEQDRVALTQALEAHNEAVSRWKAKIEQEHQALESERNSIREQIRLEIESEFAEQRAALNADQDELATQVENHKNAVQSWNEEVARRRAVLDQEERIRRESLQLELDEKTTRVRTELDAEKAKLTSELSDFETTRQRWSDEREKREEDLRQQLDARKQEFESKLAQREAEFDDGQRVKREELLAEIRRHRKEVENSLTQERAELTKDQAELSGNREKFLQQQDEWRVTQKEEQKRLLAELENQRSEKLAALDHREQQIRQREIDLEKRTKLHATHLDRVKMDLQNQTSEIERKRQQQRIWREEVEATIRLRLTQMRRFRDLIDQREQCLEQEQELFANSRRDSQLDFARRNDQFAKEKDRWDQQQHAAIVHLGELRDALQAEVDVAGNWSLELQRLVEAVKSQSGTVREDSIDLAKKIDQLAESVLSCQKNLAELRQLDLTIPSSLPEASAATDKTTDPEDLSTWQTLTQREEELAAAWDQWREDRVAAERVIRRLVSQLETALAQIEELRADHPEKEDSSSGHDESPSRSAA